MTIAGSYARTMTRAWMDLDERMRKLEDLVRSGGGNSPEAVYIAGEIHDARLPLIRTAADAGTFASAYDLGAADERERASEAARVVPLYPVPITA